MTHVYRNPSRRSERRRVWWAVLAASLLAGPMARAAGNIDPANNFAWSENAGWINFAPTNGGVTVAAGQGLSGYAWAENIGWIQLACTNNSTCNNTSATDWGVKLTGKNALQGFAWSENAGWINFGPTNGGVTITNGWFYGYAWSENVGWIHLNGSPTYGVRTTANLVTGMAIYFR